MISCTVTATNIHGSAAATANAVGPITQAGTALTEITSLSPTVYLPLNEASGSSFNDAGANNLDGTLIGSGTTYGHAMRRGTGIRTHGTSRVEVGHSTTHFQRARSDPRLVVDSEVVMGVSAIFPSLSDWTPVFSKDLPLSAFRMGVALFVHANGTAHLRVWSPWGSTAEVKTRPGVVIAGQEHDYQVGLGRAGAWLKVDGRMAHDGVPDLRHWYGWQFIMIGGGSSGGLRPEGWNVRNTGPLQIGAHGASNISDGIFGHFYCFARWDRNDPLTQTEVDSLTGQSGAPLDHPVYGNSSENFASGTAADLQAAINRRQTAGGGRVIMTSATYSFSASVTLKPGVELVAGSGVAGRAEITFTNGGRFVTDEPTLNNLASTATINTTSRTQSFAGPQTADDVLVYMHGSGSYYQLARNDPTIEPVWRTGDMVPLEARTASTVTFARRPLISSTSAQRSGGLLYWFTPWRYMSLRRLRIVATHAFTNYDYYGKTPFCVFRGVRDFRVHDCDIRQLGTSAAYDNQVGILTDGLVDAQLSNSLLGSEAPDVVSSTGTEHPYGWQAWGGSGFVAKACEFRSGNWSSIDSDGSQMALQWGGVLPAHGGGKLVATYDCRVDCVFNQTGNAAGSGGAVAGGSHEAMFNIWHGITCHRGGTSGGKPYSDLREVTINNKFYLGASAGMQCGLVDIDVLGTSWFGYLRGNGFLTDAYLANITCPNVQLDPSQISFSNCYRNNVENSNGTMLSNSTSSVWPT